MKISASRKVLKNSKLYSPFSRFINLQEALCYYVILNDYFTKACDIEYLLDGVQKKQQHNEDDCFSISVSFWWSLKKYWFIPLSLIHHIRVEKKLYM